LTSSSLQDVKTRAAGFLFTHPHPHFTAGTSHPLPPHNFCTVALNFPTVSQTSTWHVTADVLAPPSEIHNCFLTSALLYISPTILRILNIMRLCFELYFIYLCFRSRYSSGLRAGRSGLASRQGQDFLFSTASKSTLGPPQPPIQWLPGALSPGREDDHSPPLSAEVNNGGAIPPLPIHLHGPCQQLEVYGVKGTMSCNLCTRKQSWLIL
jgi:hypothetical protein